MTKVKEYIEVEKFYDSLNDVKNAINNLGQALGDKIDQNKRDLDAQILKMHLEYTTRLTTLEVEKKGEWKTRILYMTCAAMFTYIVNHILT